MGLKREMAHKAKRRKSNIKQIEKEMGLQPVSSSGEENDSDNSSSDESEKKRKKRTKKESPLSKNSTLCHLADEVITLQNSN